MNFDIVIDASGESVNFFQQYFWTPLFLATFLIINLRYVIRFLLAKKGVIVGSNFKRKKLNLVFIILTTALIALYSSINIFLLKIPSYSILNDNGAACILFLIQVAYFIARLIAEHKKAVV